MEDSPQFNPSSLPPLPIDPQNQSPGRHSNISLFQCHFSGESKGLNLQGYAQIKNPMDEYEYFGHSNSASDEHVINMSDVTRTEALNLEGEQVLTIKCCDQHSIQLTIRSMSPGQIVVRPVNEVIQRDQMLEQKEVITPLQEAKNRVQRAKKEYEEAKAELEAIIIKTQSQRLQRLIKTKSYRPNVDGRFPSQETKLNFVVHYYPPPIQGVDKIKKSAPRNTSSTLEFKILKALYKKLNFKSSYFAIQDKVFGDICCDTLNCDLGMSLVRKMEQQVREEGGQGMPKDDT